LIGINPPSIPKAGSSSRSARMAGLSSDTMSVKGAASAACTRRREPGTSTASPNPFIKKPMKNSGELLKVGNQAIMISDRISAT